MRPLPNQDTDSPTHKVIDVLLRRGPLTVAELTRELGVTATAVRQQVRRLADEGWLTRTRRGRGLGRPADMFAISKNTRRLIAAGGPDVSQLLIQAIADLDGEDKARAILQHVNQRMVDAARPGVSAGPASERVDRLATFLERQGIVVESGSSPRGQRLAIFTCPYAGLVEDHRELCDMEQTTFSALTDSAVRRHHCMLDGHGACEFTFSPRDGAAGPDKGQSEM